MSSLALEWDPSFYLEHGSEGACNILSLIKSQKQPLILYSEFEPNSRQTVLRQPRFIDSEVPIEY